MGQGDLEERLAAYGVAEPLVEGDRLLPGVEHHLALTGRLRDGLGEAHEPRAEAAPLSVKVHGDLAHLDATFTELLEHQARDEHAVLERAEVPELRLRRAFFGSG